ncbi:MAG: hypothetical protein FWH03_04470 [Firmicutes bacterium]|nr:hypothetical protein [Bacillota bacterium]
MEEKQNLTEIAENAEKLKRSLFEKFSDLRLRIKVLLFFSPAIVFTIYLLVAVIFDVDSYIFNLIVFTPIVFPLLVGIGIYIQANKKRTRKLWITFIVMLLLAGHASFALAVLFAFWTIDLGLVYRYNPVTGTWAYFWSAHIIAHLIFFIISILLLIAVMVFFTIEAKTHIKNKQN